MPVPASTTILLFAAFLAVVSLRVIPIRRSQIVGLAFVFVSLIVAAGFLLLEQNEIVPSEQGGAATMVWCSDDLTRAEQWLVLTFGLFAGLSLVRTASTEHDLMPSRYGFLLFLIAGMWAIAQSNDFLVLGLSLEIVNLALTGLRNASAPKLIVSEDRLEASSEHSFVGLTSCMMWLGIGLLSNATSTTNYDGLRKVLTDSYHPPVDQLVVGAPSKLILLASGLIAMSLFARMRFIPFHHSSGNKSQFGFTSFKLAYLAKQLIGWIALTRLFGCVLVGLSHSLTSLLMAIVLATSALTFISSIRAASAGVKSMPQWMFSLAQLQHAWIAISLMIVISELDNPGVRGGVFVNQYETLAIIVFSQFAGLIAGCGIIALLHYLTWQEREIEFIEDLKGLWQVAPVAAIAVATAFGSLIGIPFTAGFWSRWLTLLAGQNVHGKSQSTVFSPNFGLRLAMLAGIVAMLPNALIFSRLLREMFLDPPLARPKLLSKPGSMVSIAIAVVAILLFGIAPQIAMTPLGSIRPPIAIEPDSQQTGSGTMPVGLNFNQRPAELRAPDVTQ